MSKVTIGDTPTQPTLSFERGAMPASMNDAMAEGVKQSFRILKIICHRTSVDKGFYETPRRFGESVALMHSELSEALEAWRKDLNDDHLPHRKGIECEFADVLIRIFDTAQYLNLDIEGAILEKMAYNENREKMHGGKKI